MKIRSNIGWAENGEIKPDGVYPCGFFSQSHLFIPANYKALRFMTMHSKILEQDTIKFD